MPAIPPLGDDASSLPRIVTYFQTLHDPAGKSISILPLLQHGISVTHVILAAIHVNHDPHGLHLNDHPPNHPRYDTLWAELRVLQASGVKVLGMLGGAARGTYERLSGPDEVRFEMYYAPLRDMIRERGLDGMDLDVEEPTSLADIVRLIDRLRADFGPGFIITLAPVAAALVNPEANLSGFDYEALEVMRGAQIAFYNAQFYNGWGDMSNLFMYEMMLQKGWPVHKLVVGLVTNPDNGRGFIPWEFQSKVLALCRQRYERFGGIMGWEYFNSLPGGQDRPWEWAEQATTLLRSQYLPQPPQPGPGPRPDPGRDGHDVDNDLPGDPAQVPKAFEYYSDGGDE